MARSVFSVSFNMIVSNQTVPYDIYVNSSSVEDRERFVRVFKKDDFLSADDLWNFRSKYIQLYVAEEQRAFFVKSLQSTEAGNDQEKALILKDSAIGHLETLFAHDFTVDVLGQTILGIRDVVDSMINVLQNYDIDRLRSLIASLSLHDSYTYDHSVNVSMYTITLYKAVYPNATNLEIMQAGMSGLIHDIGKVKIPTNVINNPGNLSPEDGKMIKKHPEYGVDLLAEASGNLPAEFNVPVLARAVLEHHENFDGAGYPRKIAGEQIHKLARIVAIADFYDAITTKRTYQESLNEEEALALMEKYSGKKLDPELFKIFKSLTRYANAELHTDLKISNDFDPSQPHEKLPVIKQPEGQGPENFGQIKVIASEADAKTIQKSDKIKVISIEKTQKTHI